LNGPSRVDTLREMTERLTYTVLEAARLLGISRGAAYEGVASGEIPSIRIGRRLLVPRAAFNRLLDLKDAPVEADHKAETIAEALKTGAAVAIGGGRREGRG
jgi:excisionase family DNA binding protein